MVRHKNMVHSDQARKFKWPYEECLSNGFIDNYHLRRHIKSVHEEEFVCQICQEQSQNCVDDKNTSFPKYRFKKKKQLAKHRVDVHNKRANFECKFWSKGFVNEKTFTTHVKRHEDKMLRKNKQMVDINFPDQFEEWKEHNLQDTKNDIWEDLHEDDSLFKLESQKRFKVSDSIEQMLSISEKDNKLADFKVFFYTDSLQFGSSNLEIKPSENDTLFNDSSVRDFFIKRETDEVAYSKMSQNQYLWKELGWFKSFYSVSLH